MALTIDMRIRLGHLTLRLEIGWRNIEARFHSRPELTALAAITAIATTLRVHSLGKLSLWADEGFSAYMAQLPWSEISFHSQDQVDALFQYLTLHYLLRIGNSEFTVRLPSVLFSVATVPLIYLSGKRLFDRRVGIVGALLLTFNAVAIEYAQEARNYSIVIFLVTLSSIYFLRIAEQSRPRDAILYTAASAAAVYAHLFAGFVLMAQWLWLLLVRRRGFPWKLFAAIFTAIVLVCSPYLNVMIRLPPGWIPRTSSRSFVPVLFALTGVARPGNGPWKLYVTASVLALVVATTAIAIVAYRSSFDRVKSYLFALSGVLVPLLVAGAASLRTPAIVDRYFLVCLPFATLLMAAALCLLRQRLIFASAVTIVLGFFGTQDYRYFLGHRKQDWRSATNYVLANQKSGDAVVVVGDEMTFDYYRQRFDGARDPTTVVRPVMTAEPAADTSRRIQEFRRSIRSISCSHPRVWLVVTKTLSHAQHLVLGTAYVLHRQYYDEKVQDFFQVGVMLFALPTGRCAAAPD